MNYLRIYPLFQNDELKYFLGAQMNFDNVKQF